MDKLIGKMLDGRYEILDVIGRGGMSVVYSAKCHRLNRIVAIKVLKDEFLEDLEFKNRFQDESISVAMLSHPNIVSVYDVSRSADIEYIVMELIDGITLKEYLVKKAPLTWQETTFFSIQIAKALQHAHSRGVIHRDIKPQNIMILRDGTVKVADFGIAHQVTKQHTYNKGEAIGSVHYISPEQALGSRIDNRADIYSLGVAMYEMLTGRLPFEGESPVEIAMQHVKSVPLHPSDYVQNIPKAMENVTMKAMNPNIKGRYADAEALIADLDKIRNDPMVEIELPAVIAFENTGEDTGQATQKINYQHEVKVKPQLEGDEPTYREGRAKVSNKGLIFNIVAILAFVLGGVYFIFAVVNPFAGGGDYSLKTPDFVGKVFTEIKVDKAYEMFTILEGERIYSEDVAEGVVISQTPEKGRKIGEGGEVTVVISRGEKTSTMPDFANLEYRSAEIELDKLGIKYTEKWEYNDSIEKNRVISATPGKGTVLTDDVVVLLKISKGKELIDVKMPNIIGMAEGDAKKAIDNASLKVGTVTKVESTQPEGQVIFQAIPSGSVVSENTSVDFQISKIVPPKKVAKILSVPMVEEEGAIKVEVLIDGQVQYSANHFTNEGVAEIPLVAFEGTHKVTVKQNGKVTTDEDMVF